MPYKNKEKHKISCLRRYYQNRDIRLEYQKKYDNINKAKKREYEKSRRKNKRYNLVKNIQHFSRIHYFSVLVNNFKKCQFCGSGEKLEIHHKKYTKNIKDCLLLCQSCHKKIHRKV